MLLGNNGSCSFQYFVLLLKIVADVAVNATTAGDGSMMVREHPSQANITIDIKNIDGVTIPGVSRVHDNFNISVFFSDIDCTSMRTNCSTRNAMFKVTNPAQWTLPLQVNETQSLLISVIDTLAMHVCDWIKFICIHLFEGIESVYIEKDTRNNLHCTTAPVMCRPGRTYIK